MSKDEKGTLYAVVSGFRVRHICPFGKTCMHISKDGGYPCTLEMEDGSLLTVYYQKVPGDEKTSFLYTKWKLNK